MSQRASASNFPIINEKDEEESATDSARKEDEGFGNGFQNTFKSAPPKT